MNNSATREEIAYGLFDQVQSSFTDRDFKTANELLRRINNDYSDLFNSWYLNSWIGLCHCMMENYSEAIIALEESRRKIDQDEIDEHGHNYLQVLDHLGHSYYESKQYENALECYERAEKYVGYYDGEGQLVNLRYFRVRKARVYLEMKKYEEAFLQYNLARKTLPNNGSDKISEAVLNYEIGKTYYYQDEQESANKQLSSVIEKNLPDAYLPQFYLIMVKNLNKTENYDRVLHFIKKIESIGTPEVWAAEFYNLAGRAHYFLRNLSEAKRYFLKSNEFPPESDWIPKHNGHFLNLLRPIKLDD